MTLKKLGMFVVVQGESQSFNFFTYFETFDIKIMYLHLAILSWTLLAYSPICPVVFYIILSRQAVFQL